MKVNKAAGLPVSSLNKAAELLLTFYTPLKETRHTKFPEECF